MITAEKIVLKHIKTITLRSYYSKVNLSKIKELWPASAIGYFDPLLETGLLKEEQVLGEQILIDISEMQPGQKAVLNNIFDKEAENIWIPQNRIIQVLEDFSDELIRGNIGNLFPIQTKNGVKYVLDIRINLDNKLDFRLYDNWGEIEYFGDDKHRVFTHAA